MAARECTRRSILAGLAAMAGSALAPGRAAGPVAIQPRCRVILDNDFAGDPDGLFQMAHHLLSPAAEVRHIIGSHLHAGEGLMRSGNQATASAAKARELLATMKLDGRYTVIAGAETALASDTPPASAAADAIIAEALQAGEKLPLFYCAGAGLTDLATAWLREPRIAKHLTLVWIGGQGPRAAGDHEARRSLHRHRRRRDCVGIGHSAGIGGSGCDHRRSTPCR